MLYCFADSIDGDVSAHIAFESIDIEVSDSVKQRE